MQGELGLARRPLCRLTATPARAARCFSLSATPLPCSSWHHHCLLTMAQVPAAASPRRLYSSSVACSETLTAPSPFRVLLLFLAASSPAFSPWSPVVFSPCSYQQAQPQLFWHQNTQLKSLPSPSPTPRSRRGACDSPCGI